MHKNARGSVLECFGLLIKWSVRSSLQPFYETLFSGADAFLESFEPTFSAYLNRTVGEVFPGVGFVAVPLAFEDVWPAVSSATVDFLFLNPSAASCMERQDKQSLCQLNGTDCAEPLCAYGVLRVPLVTARLSNQSSLNLPDKLLSPNVVWLAPTFSRLSACVV